jgi:glycosyltransferase involved in cell wall biosynthesis
MLIGLFGVNTTKDTPLKLLVVTQYFWPENFKINDLVSDLVSRGHEVTILTGYPNYPEGRIFPGFHKNNPEFAEYAGARIYRVPVVPRGKTSYTLALNYLSFVFSGIFLGSWRLRGMRFGCIFVYQPGPLTAALPALVLRKLKRTPVAIWVLDLWPETLSAVRAVRSTLLLSAIGKMVKFIYRRCDRILVQSTGFLSSIEKHGGDPKDVLYFPSWAEQIFDESLDNAQNAPEMEQFRDTFNVLFAGNIGEAQDFPSILEAVEALNDRPMVRWLILGEGRAANYVRSEIVRRKLADRVFMLGRHPIERMPSFFRSANALLVSLKHDDVFSLTIPAKVQTSMAAGLPLLGMLDGEGSRVILEAKAGMVGPAGNGQALAQNVRDLTDLSPSQRKTLGDNGREYCFRHFNRSTLISSLECWLADLVLSTQK